MNAGAPSLGRLLIVDDEPAQVKALCDTLRMEGYETRGFTSGMRALAAPDEERFDVVLTDLVMPYMDGIALIEAARQRDPDLVAVVMTGHGTIDTAVRAMQMGALDYVLKPFRLRVVLPVLERALTVRRLQLENRELARRIEERTRELEIANEELEGFSYSVSHDLRTPVRAVHACAQGFLEEHGAGVSAEGRELLDKVLAGARRADELIEDLLALASVGRQPLRFELLDMESLTRRVAAELADRESERQVEVVIRALPACRGDRSLIEQVVLNLLSNAFPDSLHVKHQPQHRWTLYNRNVDWFRFWLQGHEDQSLEKGAQYARWRTLRERRAADVKKQQDAGTTPTSLRGLAAPLALVEVAGRPRSCAAQTASRCRNRVRAVPTS